VKTTLLEKQGDFLAGARIRLVLLASLMALLWYLGMPPLLGGDERALWEKVRSAQTSVFEIRGGEEYDADPQKTGFIGVEWSPLTTTLGPLEAKIISANPLWAVYALRQLRRLGIAAGDRVALLSSSSFPGLVFSVLAAAEHRDAHILWIHSLGSSTWGANDPAFSWPALATALRQGGFLSKKADWYTLGGKAEMGLDLPEEGRKILIKAAASEGTPLLEAPSLPGMIDLKWDMVARFAPRILISVGGGAAAFAGNHADFLRGGFFQPSDPVPPGEGVLQKALASDIPVLHFLDMKGMARRSGVPLSGSFSPRFVSFGGRAASGAGLLLFFVFLLFFKRWDRWKE
jgi:poly-gamma-glutamate system protein